MSAISVSGGVGSLSCKEVSHNSNEWKPGTVKVVGKRCGCGLSFCPHCGKRAVRRGLSRLSKMVWECVREVELTLDPRKYPDPAQAVKLMSKAIGYFIASLKAHGVTIIDWVVFLEWHASGLPHYHLFIQVDKRGRAGMIGYEKIKSLWEHGLVREWPIRSEKHWVNKIGYAGKSGYLHKAKRHQVVYPAWALASKVRIRRVHGQQNREDQGSIISDENDFDVWMRKYGFGGVPKLRAELHTISNDLQMTNEQKLSKCGEQVYIYYASRGSLVRYQGRARLSFHEFLGMGGKYQEGLGYVLELCASDLLEFHAKYFPTGGGGL